MKKKPVGISTMIFQVMYDDKRALEIAAEIGADCVDLATFAFSKPKRWDYRNPDSLYAKGDNAVIDYYKGLKEYATALGLVINQTHGRGRGLINNADEDDAEIMNGRLDLLAASAVGASTCVMHSPTSIIHGANVAPELMRELGFKQYMALLPYAAEYKVKLATETFGDATGLNCLDFFGDVTEFIKLFDRVRKASPFGEWFTVCMDTGHTNKSTRFNNPKVGDVIRMIGSDITVLHLNDNDTLTDQHKAPMTGNIDWTDTMNALDEIGFDGVYNLELNERHFGDGFEIENDAFAIKVMKHILKTRYGGNL